MSREVRFILVEEGELCQYFLQKEVDDLERSEKATEENAGRRIVAELFQ